MSDEVRLLPAEEISRLSEWLATRPEGKERLYLQRMIVTLEHLQTENQRLRADLAQWRKELAEMERVWARRQREAEER